MESMEPNDVEVRIYVDSEGKIRKCGKYHPDVYVHPGDTVTFTCTEAPFRVSNIHKAEDCCSCVESPFTDFNEGKIDKGGRNRSGPVLEEASGHLYKSTWEVFDEFGKVTDGWDPHIHVG